jgi:uncharacterized membrane protein
MIFDELAREVFSILCHQDPARTFEPGGEPLVLCARCAGVYVGFALTIPMLFMVRRLPGRLAVWVHGALVLQVILFGFHLIPHGLTVGAISGQLFAVGVVYFLFKGVRYGKFRVDKPKEPRKHTGRWFMRYLLGTAQAVVLLQLLLRLGWSWAATLINILALVGLATFVGLAVALLLGLGRSIIAGRQAARIEP